MVFLAFGLTLGFAGGDETGRTGKDRKMIEKISWRAATLHTTAIIAALIVFAVTFTYTGNADLLTAITAGLAAGLLIYLTVHIFRDKSGEK